MEETTVSTADDSGEMANSNPNPRQSLTIDKVVCSLSISLP